MNSFQILEAIGELDESTVRNGLFVPRSDKSSGFGAKNRRIKKWLLTAACICFVAVITLTVTIGFGKKSDKDFLIQNHVLVAYNGNETNVTIPDSVVCIANYAFANSDNADKIETITLGKQLSRVETLAFDGCTNLSLVQVSKDNHLLQVDNRAVLSADGKQLIYLNADDSMTSFSVPNGVEKICSYAFVHSGLRELTLPESVTELEPLAVIFNDSLEKVTLNGIISLSERAFYHNISLQSVSLPRATEIGEAAFAGCTALESVDLPQTTRIQKDAFSDCVRLQSVNAPNVQQIGDGAFYGCEQITGLSLPSAVSIGDSCFRGCRKLTLLSVPKATNFGDWCIAETNISVLALPSVTEGLGEYTFAGSSLSELQGKRDGFLEQYADTYHYSFSEINETELPDGFYAVHDTMYVSVSSVNVRSTPDKSNNVVGYLVLDQAVERIATDGTWSMFRYSNGKYCYVSNSCLSLTNSHVQPIETTDLTYGDFNYQEKNGSIIITKYNGTARNVLIPLEINGKPVPEIQANAFYGTAERILSLEANSVETISGNDAFLAHCYCLEAVSMQALKALPAGAFSECVSLKNVNLKSLTSIGANVFSCGTFTELYLTDIKSIADDAFKKSGIKTLHAPLGSYAQQWAQNNGLGFVDIENDYTPTYPEATVDASRLVYTGIYQGKSANGENFGYAGVELAHDPTGKLYLHIPKWSQYISTPFSQYESFESDTVRMEYQTAAVCGDYAWLIASNGTGSKTSTLSVIRTDRQGNRLFGLIEFSATRYLQGLYCHFDSETDGKLIVYESDKYQRCSVYETTDGGQTWNSVTGSTVSSGDSHESVRSAGFVNENVGFVSFSYFAVEQPADRTYLTFDGGKTWKKWDVTLSPEIIKDGYGETVELTTDGAKLILTVVVRGGSFTEEVYYRYSSSDNGISWNQEGEKPIEENPEEENPTDTVLAVNEYRNITGVNSINVRAERNLTSKIVATLVKDTQVHQVERITTPDGEVWARIEFPYQGTDPSPSLVAGYLKQKYLSENTVTPEPEKEDSAVMEPYDKDMLIAADNMLAIRSEPSLSASVIRTLYRGTNVHQIGIASAVDADGIQWAKVEFEDVSTDGRVTVTVGYTNVKYLSDTVENNKTYTYSKQSNTLIFNYFAGGEVTLPQDFASAFVKPMTEKSMGNMAIPYVTVSKTALLCTEDKQSYYVLFSEDAGKTWTKGTAFTPSDENLSESLSDTVFDAYLMDFQTKDTGVLLIGRGNATEGFRNLLYTTEDGGKTWTFRNEVASLGFSALSYLDSGKIVIGYVYGNAGVELHSTSDFGATFTEKLFDMGRVMVNDIVKIDCIGKWNDTYFGGLSKWDDTEREWQLLPRLKVQSYDGGVTWSLSDR